MATRVLEVSIVHKIVYCTKAVCELHTKLEPQTLIAMQGLSYILDHHTVAIWSKVKSQSIFYMSPKSQISNTCKSIADETFPVKKLELYYGTESTLWKKKQKTGHQSVLIHIVHCKNKLVVVPCNFKFRSGHFPHSLRKIHRYISTLSFLISCVP